MDNMFKEFYTGYNAKPRIPSMNKEDRLMLKGLVVGTGAKTLLDYGSGQGHQYTEYKMHEAFNIELEDITCYDMGVPRFSKLPNKDFDGVVCTDVLEHIPEEQLDEALHNIFSRARKFVYLAIYCGLATSEFPDGTNAHVTIKRPKEWREIINKYSEEYGVPFIATYRIPTNPIHNILGL